MMSVYACVYACVRVDQRSDDVSPLSFELSIMVGYNLVQGHHSSTCIAVPRFD